MLIYNGGDMLSVATQAQKAKTYLDRLIKYEEEADNDQSQCEPRNYPGDRSLAD